MTKNTTLLLALALPILLMGAGCTAQNSDNLVGDNYTSPSSSSASSTTEDGSDELAVLAVVEPGVAVIKTKTGTATAATQSYTDALRIYSKIGTRFQFASCSGNPGTLNIKRGTKFMIDNRDSASHEIGIGTQTYRLAAYGFAIVSIQKTGSYNITCDGGGAAHVGVEN